MNSRRKRIGDAIRRAELDERNDRARSDSVVSIVEKGGNLPDRFLHVALPFCHLTLKAPKPITYPYPKILKTLGEHLHKRRIDLGLTQQQVGEMIKVSYVTIGYWERNVKVPLTPYVPRICQFIGYVPYGPDMTLGERFRVWRQSLGLNQKQLAKKIGTNEHYINFLENGKRIPFGKVGDALRSCVHQQFGEGVKR